MMSYMELATYLGLANTVMKNCAVQLKSDGEDTEMIETIREALVQSQLVMSKMAIDQLVSETTKGEPK